MEDWVRRAARERPGHLAVETAGGSVTYAELDSAADRTARRLAALGVRAGDRVATTLPPSTAFAELLHALPRLGAALVPVNLRLPADQQRRHVELSGSMFTVRGPLDGLEADVTPSAELDPAGVHSVLFTSGTSGEPKPVTLTVANQEAAAAASAGALGSDPADRWLCPLPLFHIGGLAILVRSARAGTTAVLQERFTSRSAIDAFAHGGITLASLVPTMLARLRDSGLQTAPSLRALLLGGGPIPPDLLDWARELGLPVRCTYGMTETCSQVVVTEPWEPAGRPGAGAEVTIGAGGEILVRGPMVAPGTAGEGGWLHTGDVGRIDRHGRLHVQGRMKDLIVTGGENVWPPAVEAVLLAHPAIADAAVAGLPSPEWGEEVTAFVVEAHPVSDYELLSFCREYLAGYQVPKRVERVHRLPRNDAGKLLRAQLVPSQ